MVVIENNYDKITCPYCNSVLGVQQKDIVEGYLGILEIECPCCGEMIDYGEKEITMDNIEFPKHFYYFGNTPSKVTEKDIKEFIHKAINYFREHKDNYGYYSSMGRHLIVVKRWPGDKCYAIYVAENYWSSEIPFADEDKWEGWDNFDKDDD